MPDFHVHDAMAEVLTDGARLYEIRRDADGTWTIVNTVTGAAASFGGKLQVGKSWIEALYFSVLMNRRAARSDADMNRRDQGGASPS